MSRIQSLSYDEFMEIFEAARIIHRQQEEPIPEITPLNIPKIYTALEQPFQTFNGKFLYPGFVEKAALMFYLIINNHTLMNGNKRMACLILGFFCVQNSYKFSFPDEELRLYAKEAASIHDRKDYMHRLEDFIRANIKKTRPFQLRKKSRT